MTFVNNAFVIVQEMAGHRIYDKLPLLALFNKFIFKLVQWNV